MHDADASVESALDVLARPHVASLLVRCAKVELADALDSRGPMLYIVDTSREGDRAVSGSKMGK